MDSFAAMPVLLIPPTRTETSKGYLWWRKKEVVLTSKVLAADQAQGVILALVQSLSNEFQTRKGLHSIVLQIVGDISAVLEIHRQLCSRLADESDVHHWLFEQLPLFIISLESDTMGPIKAFTYETVGGERVVNTVSNSVPGELAEDGECDADLIVPRIKNVAFADSMETLAEGKSEQSKIIVEPFVGDLCVSYAFEGKELYRALNAGDHRKLDIPLHDLRERALSNVRSRTDGFGAEDNDGYTQLVIGNDMEACLLLFDDIWETFEADSQSELVAVVPTRSVLAFARTDSSAGIEALKSLVGYHFAREATHQLSRHLFVRRNGSWEVLE